MNFFKLIMKEVGGRLENAGGSIDSGSNMFRGSSGNAPSDKIMGGGGNNNPIMDEEAGTTTETEVQGETPEEKTDGETAMKEAVTTETETDTSDIGNDDNIMSDVKLKNVEVQGGDYNTYKRLESKPLAGMLKNLDLDPRSQKPVTEGNGGGGGNMGGIMNMIKGFGGGGGADAGAGADVGGDMASGAGDMADMGDMADAADSSSDERLKNIFGDNEDAIRCFANINAIKFTYNEKAKEIDPSGNHGVDDDPHYGVKAQELAQNPLTETAVSKDPISDYLQVDTKELTMANTAIISEICKRILIIEKVLGIKVV